MKIYFLSKTLYVQYNLCFYVVKKDIPILTQVFDYYSIKIHKSSLGRKRDHHKIKEERGKSVPSFGGFVFQKGI